MYLVCVLSFVSVRLSLFVAGVSAMILVFPSVLHVLLPCYVSVLRLANVSYTLC